MKPLNSSKSHRLLDLVPSVKPSVVSVMLVFVCGVLWVKNETTNERLIALESRLHCFSCVKSISTENLDKMTPSPTKHSAKYHYKNIRTPISEGIGHKSTQVRYSLSRPTGNVQTYIFKCFLTQRQFSENICSEDNLRSRIFGTFVVKFLGFLPLVEFSNI